MPTFSFDHLPQAVHEIQQQLERIERLLIQLTKDGIHAEHILTVAEAAEFLDLSVSTIYKMTSQGELPFMKRSKRCYFSKNELMTYLQSYRRGTNAEIEAEADGYLLSKKVLRR